VRGRPRGRRSTRRAHRIPIRRQQMTPHRPPRFRELDENDIRSILGRNSVGRLVFDWGGRIDVRPLLYVYSNGRIYGRTSHNANFVQRDSLPAPVVFEVDEIEAVLHWKSVIVRGEFSLLDADGEDMEERERAIALLHRVVKGSFTEGDPVPQRDRIFRITVDEATGRASE